MIPVTRLQIFDRALQLHLEANCARKYDWLQDTTAEDEALYVPLPGTQQIEGRSSILEAKQRWFQKRDWAMTARVAWTMELDETALAVVDVTYSDADTQGLPRDQRFKQFLVFRKDVNRAWKAVAEVASS